MSGTDKGSAAAAPSTPADDARALAAAQVAEVEARLKADEAAAEAVRKTLRTTATEASSVEQAATVTSGRPTLRQLIEADASVAHDSPSVFQAWNIHAKATELVAALKAFEGVEGVSPTLVKYIDGLLGVL